MEQWKCITEYNSLYKISDLGNVVRVKTGRVLKQQKNLRGYLFVNLSMNGKFKPRYIHQLVAEYFLGHIHDNKTVVDHIDNNKQNNTLSNLQIITQRENISKDIKGKTSAYIGVSKVKSNGLWAAQITINKKVLNLGCFETEIEASKAYNNRLYQANNEKNNAL